MTKREIAKQFILKHPEMPTRAAAENLLKLEPLFFSSFERARQTVKALRGVGLGKRNASFKKIQDTPKPSVPESSEHEWIPFQLGAENRDKVALLSDIHVPYHNRMAVELAITEAVHRKANIVLLNGDTMDAHELSRFEKDPRERCFREELPLVKQLLEYIRHKLPKARIIWKDGNHDERLYLYLRRNAPAVLGLDCFEAPAVLGFDKYGVEYVTGKRPIICGKLNILHGHEYPASSLGQVNPARGLFLRAGACTIEGHFHQTSEHSQPTLEGKNVSCWSTGCLAELHPPYMPLNKWNHGFAMIEMGKDGNFKVRNHKIINGEVY